MTLVYARQVHFLSPSALANLESSPADFYLRRLGPPEFAPPPEPQSFPAAVGIAFDAMVKTRVAQERKLRCPSLDFMLNDVRCERERTLDVAAALLAGYEGNGAFRRLLEEKPTHVAVDGEDFAPGTRVPVRTRIDAVTTYKDRMTIHDWKVRGANRPGSASPTAGYTTLWDTDSPGMSFGPHPKWALPMEEIDPEWATQLCIYGWSMGLPISTDVWGSIDQIVAWTDGRVRVAQFRNPISEGFQRGVIDRLREAWRKITEKDVVPNYLTIEQLRVMI